MFSKLYMKMAGYFSAIIAVTLVAVALLFFFTLGLPLARDIHSMLRNHTRYMGALVKDAAGPARDMDAVSKAVRLFSEEYGFDVGLFGENKRPVVSSPGFEHCGITLTPGMIQRVEAEGIFVQPSHFGHPLIYAFKETLSDGSSLFIVMTRHFRENRPIAPFVTGLAVLGCLLLAAVYPLSRSITRPLSELSGALTRMARGEFCDAPHVGKRSDEIGEVIAVFRSMSRSVDRMIQSKKQLLADISHELCSPLARIRVGIELIRDTGRDDNIQRYATGIERDITSMDHLIMNLAVYSRLNLPGFALSMKAFDPSHLVSHVAAQYRPLAGKRGIALFTDIPANLPAMTGDFERLKQVFSNLMDNALRYTENGGCITLGIGVKSESLSFFVEDQGPGVPEGLEEKIFEPLFRVDAARNEDSGGSGLGLAICRRIMELHGGTVVYSRTPDKTRMIFRLPVQPASESSSS